MNDLNNTIFNLIREKDLSLQDIKDVIAEQVYSAKSSDIAEVSNEAMRLEKLFGSKYQRENITIDYNKKADEFGGYLMSVIMQAQMSYGHMGIVKCLQALENAYNKLKSSDDVLAKISFFTDVLKNKNMFVEVVAPQINIKEARALISGVLVLEYEGHNNSLADWHMENQGSAGFIEAMRRNALDINITSYFEIKIYALEDSNGWYFDIISEIQLVTEDKPQIILKADIELETDNEVFIDIIEESFNRLGSF